MSSLRVYTPDQTSLALVTLNLKQLKHRELSVKRKWDALLTLLARACHLYIPFPSAFCYLALRMTDAHHRIYISIYRENTAVRALSTAATICHSISISPLVRRNTSDRAMRKTRISCNRSAANGSFPLQRDASWELVSWICANAASLVWFSCGRCSLKRLEISPRKWSHAYKLLIVALIGFLLASYAHIMITEFQALHNSTVLNAVNGECHLSFTQLLHLSIYILYVCFNLKKTI